MTIDEKMIKVVQELVKKYGTNYIITSFELSQIFSINYNTNPSSVLPADYCYNRINNGINLKKPTVFEFIEKSRYRCLGLNFPYNGPIYHKPIGQKEFIVGQCINGERIIAPNSNLNFEINNSNKNTSVKNNITSINYRNTKRTPSMSLRFEVLKRDNFKCCYCGASPAKNVAVELHVDHIYPWSKGGETTLNNLQTLCSKCNVGKSDKI